MHLLRIVRLLPRLPTLLRLPVLRRLRLPSSVLRRLRLSRAVLRLARLTLLLVRRPTRLALVRRLTLPMLGCPC